ncbi:MAG: hypothetical protein CJBNEKGG_03986 [Prosthecobacter sp.]|nr:hypothetical protein [Prosthecobacter sp.]
MSKIRVQRHKHYKDWELKTDLADSPYPAESALVGRLRSNPSRMFYPYPFKYTEDNDYHYHLAFLVEAVELLPMKFDLSFDAIWRAFESFYAGRVIAPKPFKPGDEAPGLATLIDGQPEHDLVLNQLLNSVPVQCCEYMIERIFSQWQVVGSDYQKIWNRLNNPAGHHNSVILLLTKMAQKYGAPHMNGVGRRQSAILLHKSLAGEEVDVLGSKIILPRPERISFMFNALLYTFRNDRFHGSMQPPFKSSVGTLQTYAHAHYCFIWGHFLFLFSATLSTPAFASHRELAQNTAQNLDTFFDFYGSHLKA